MADILNTKIKGTAERGYTSFGHNGEVYTDLRPYTTSGGLEGYRFDHGEKSDPYLKIYFISADGTSFNIFGNTDSHSFLDLNHAWGWQPDGLRRMLGER